MVLFIGRMEDLEKIEIDDIVKKAKVCELVDDFKSACQYYELSALKGDRKSFQKLITYYSREKYNRDVRSAIFWLEKYINTFSHATNNTKYEFKLGAMFANCFFSDQTKNDEDRKKAIYWLRKSYEHRQSETNQKMLFDGGVYLYKLGDYEFSYAIFDAISKSSFHPKYLPLYLGKCFLFGNGVRKNTDKAFVLLQEAANNNCPSAQSLLLKYFNTMK
jgi:TPR repeat protein